MYHPMLTFAIMQGRQEDLVRDLHHHRVRKLARQRAAAERIRLPRVRNRLTTYVRPRPSTVQLQS